MRKTIEAAVILFFLILSVGFIEKIQPKLEAQELEVRQEKKAEEKKKPEEKPHQEGVFSSHLPIIEIDTLGQDIAKLSTIWAQMKVYDENKGLNYLDDEPKYTLPVTVKHRGNSSYYNFDKKQYRVETYKEMGTDNKDNVPFLGMKSDSEWVLNAPFLDRTLMRNRIMYDAARQTMKWAPDTRYCELFLNGKYQGVYLAVEPVRVSKNRIKLQTATSVTGQTAYLAKRDREGTEITEISNFGTYMGLTGQKVSIAFPSLSKLTPEQSLYIQNDISRFERALYSEDYKDEKNGYKAYIDVDSFVTYYVLNEFFMNKDAGSLSTYMYKDLGGKLHMCVWDFNNAFDNYAWSETSAEGFYINTNSWYVPLCKDEAFIDLVVEKYHLLRKTVLSEESLLGEIDAAQELLGPAIERNFSVWGYTFVESLLSDDDEGNPRDPASYEEAVEQLKSTIIARGKFMDENIEALYQFCE
ncbi:MAG: CotH kinase family protein [Oscillospiraceae bacterium]